MNNLAKIKNNELAKLDAQLVKEMYRIESGRWSKRTKEAYISNLRGFTHFCVENNLEFSVGNNDPNKYKPFIPASPITVKAYVTYLSMKGLSWNTIQQHIAAIKAIHKVKHADNPVNEEVEGFLQGIKRKVGEAVDQKQPLLVEDIRKILELTSDDLKGFRDRALILFAFTTWLRAENLVMMEYDDISFLNDRIEVKVRKEKQDQTRKGREITVMCGKNPDTCPVLALKKWLAIAGISSGKVFRSIDLHGNMREEITYDGMRKTIKRYVEDAGYNPAKIAMHSFRSGGATQAIINGMPFDAGMEYGGWKKADTFKKYVRRGNKINATQYLGV